MTQRQAIKAGQIVSPDGTTNTLNAPVERNGKFWVQNLPLAAGTSLVSVAAINAAGKLSTTNLTVVKSDVVLTINPVPEDQLYLATVTVQGSVIGPTNAVWVNGVPADVDSGSGGWTATNVPVTSGATAVFTATAAECPDCRRSKACPCAEPSRVRPSEAIPTPHPPLVTDH